MEIGSPIPLNTNGLKEAPTEIVIPEALILSVALIIVTVLTSIKKRIFKQEK